MADLKQSEKNRQAFKHAVMPVRYTLGWKTGPFFPVASAHKIKLLPFLDICCYCFYWVISLFLCLSATSTP